MKQVRIPESLFYDLVMYHLCEIEESKERIRLSLKEKMDAMIRHECYTAYKSAQGEEEREKARNEYLERARVLPDYRW